MRADGELVKAGQRLRAAPERRDVAVFKRLPTERFREVDGARSHRAERVYRPHLRLVAQRHSLSNSLLVTAQTLKFAEQQ